MKKGDIVGHEFMGEVVETGTGVSNLRKGDRVVVPFPIACGHCEPCSARAVFALRELQPQRLDGRAAVGLRTLRHLRVLAPDGRLSRRPGRVRAGAVCRRRPAQGARRTHATSRCCSCRTSSRPASWPPRPAASGPATSSRCGAAGRWGSSPSRAPTCSARRR